MNALSMISVMITGWLLAACSIAAADTPLAQSVVYRYKGDVVSVDLKMKITEVEGTKYGIKIAATGALEGNTVGLALIVPNKWDATPMTRTDGKIQRQFLPALVRIGEPSDALDRTLRTLFKLKERETIFKREGYRGVTLGTREQLEHAEVRIGLGDHGIEGESYWEFDITLDLPNKRMMVNLREVNR